MKKMPVYLSGLKTPAHNGSILGSNPSAGTILKGQCPLSSLLNYRHKIEGRMSRGSIPPLSSNLDDAD